MQAKGRWGEKWGREWGPWVGNSNFDGWREEEEKEEKRKGRDQGTTRETAGEKLESLFLVLCFYRTRIPSPTGFFPSSKKAGPHFIGFEAHGGKARRRLRGASVAAHDGGSPMQLSFPKKG